MWVAGATALAAALRLPGLTRADLSLDESWSWTQTADILHTRDFWGSLAMGLDAPLFGAINALVAGVFGLGVGALRTPQALFGVAVIPVIYAVVRRFASEREAGWTALLCACSPFLIYYARTGRPYAQLGFFCMVWLLAASATEDWTRWRRGLVLAGCTVLAVGSHYYAAVFIAAYWAAVWAGHLRAGRRGALGADVVTALGTGFAACPLLAPVALRLGATLEPYWQMSHVSVPGVLAEQLLLPGTALADTGFVVVSIELMIVGVALAPLGVVWRRGRASLAAVPWWAWIGWLTPLVVASGGLLVGHPTLFFARGFIGATPLVLGTWVVAVSRVTPRWARWALAAALLLPMLPSTAAVAISDPAHPYLRDRHLLREVVHTVEGYKRSLQRGPGQAVVLVHHWWLAMYFLQAAEEPGSFHPLGRAFTAAGKARSTAAALGELELVPPDAMVVLVLNELAEEHTDPEGRVAAALAARRPLLEERPCHPRETPHLDLLCSRVLTYGPERPQP